MFLQCLMGIALAASAGSGLPPGWRVLSGDGWGREVDVRVLLRQGSPDGRATALNTQCRGGPRSSWRCGVQPGVGAGRCGIVFHADRDLTSGFACELGGNPGVGGFVLKDAKGKVLWEDRWAPWRAYEAVVLEGTVESGRVRAQLLAYDRRTLISQSDWVSVSLTQTEALGTLGVYTEDAIARFWQPERSDTPLRPITDDAPNRRRLVQGRDDDWALFGTGNWMWTDGTKTRVRQYAATERAWARNPLVRGADRTWRSWVRAHPGTGGAGMLFRVDENCKGGYNCWLGGKHGAGSLMLYRNAGPGGRGTAVWSSPADKWHYKEDLLLQAETRGDEVRVALIGADGKTVLAQSPWKTCKGVEPPEGYMAFHTWRGSAEFWGFADGSGAAGAPAKESATSALGDGWACHGAGAWEWVDGGKTGIRQTDPAGSGTALSTGLSGAKGAWRCRVVLSTGTGTAGLCFQVAPALDEGFACLVGADGVRLVALARQEEVLWSAKLPSWRPGSPLVIEGLVQTDRVVARVLAGDGKTLLAESAPVYVPDSNNVRRGHIGLATRNGPAEFASWTFEPEH